MTDSGHVFIRVRLPEWAKKTGNYFEMRGEIYKVVSYGSGNRHAYPNFTDHVNAYKLGDDSKTVYTFEAEDLIANCKVYIER